MRITILAAVLVLLASGHVLAQYDKTPPSPPAPKPVPRSSFIAAPVSAQVNFDAPREKMNLSLKEIYGGDFKKAGEEVGHVIEAMQSAADTTEGDALKANLLRSVVELENKRGRLRSGGSATGEEMSAMFSRALQALADHHAVLAQSHFKSGNNVAAGQDLRASVLNANQSVVWGNVKLGDEETNRLSAAGRTAKSLMEQKTVDRNATAKLMTDLEHWVRNVRGRLPKAGA
ncbi:MAG TPA: hypothetical protein VFP10_11245 [Candidatus Eisenbacteria bacterium]|nr:hypothetical protein [Candidatus Eisenbacteria bacterium]